MVYPNFLVYLQRVQHAAAHDFYYYVSGQVDEKKFEKLAEKFQTFYSTHESKHARHRRRVRGEAATVLHAVKYNDQIHFCLMSSSGSGRVHEREKLNDLRQKTLRILSPCLRFQLIHDGKSWSWSLTRDEFLKWRERIHNIASLPPSRRQFAKVDSEMRDVNIERLLDRLYSLCGFRLVRKQVGELVIYLSNEWRRLRPSSDPRPTQRTFLQYVRMLPTRVQTLQEKLSDNLKKRAAQLGQTEQERSEKASALRDTAERRRRFRAGLRKYLIGKSNDNKAASC